MIKNDGGGGCRLQQIRGRHSLPLYLPNTEGTSEKYSSNAPNKNVEVTANGF